MSLPSASTWVCRPGSWLSSPRPTPLGMPISWAHSWPLMESLPSLAPGVIFTGVPPYSLWEHPPALRRIPPHGSDTGSFLLAECFGSQDLTLVKDVDGLYDKDPKRHSIANFIREISVTELRKRELETLPFERIMLDLLGHARLLKQFQVINGRKPEQIIRALGGEHVGTIVYAD